MAVLVGVISAPLRLNQEWRRLHGLSQFVMFCQRPHLLRPFSRFDSVSLGGGAIVVSPTDACDSMTATPASACISGGFAESTACGSLTAYAAMFAYPTDAL